jgi:ribosomal protein S18 acetylase RimI-like enzyme
LSAGASEAKLDSLRRGEIPAAARLLARAFEHDPIIGWFLRGPSREAGFRAFFRVALYESLAAGEVTAAREGGRFVGVAAWVRPDAVEVPPDARTRANARELRRLFPASFKLVAGFDALAAHHPREPHWYLAFVGIEPGSQRRRLGSRLVEHGLDRADATGTPCYLETPFPETIPFYRRLGFDVVSELRAFEAPLSVWSMLRPAQTELIPTGASPSRPGARA